jgi:hypothetical protein
MPAPTAAFSWDDRLSKSSWALSPVFKNSQYVGAVVGTVLGAALGDVDGA